jgi:hypothetical protein
MAIARRRARAAVAVLLLMPLAACLTRREHGLVDAWLHCIECSDGESDSLRALGQRKEWALARRLRKDLLAGPSSQRRHNMQEQFRSTWHAVRVYASHHPDDHLSALQVDEADYVRAYLDNYLALYRVRAGVGLARAVGGRAIPALTAALQGELATPGDTLREDVKAALDFDRDSIAK